MWRIYRTAKTFGVRPSDLLEVEDSWLALQFDNAVTLVGTALENAAQERENYGSRDKPDWGPKYSMEQLLDPDFRLPRAKTMKDRQRDFVSTLKAMAGRKGSGVGYIKITDNDK